VETTQIAIGVDAVEPFSAASGVLSAGHKWR
jgi:hypothetical protein